MARDARGRFLPGTRPPKRRRKTKRRAPKRRRKTKRRAPKRRAPKRRKTKRRAPKRRKAKRRAPRRRKTKRRAPKRRAPKEPLHSRGIKGWTREEALVLIPLQNAPTRTRPGHPRFAQVQRSRALRLAQERGMTSW